MMRSFCTARIDLPLGAHRLPSPISGQCGRGGASRPVAREPLVRRGPADHYLVADPIVSSGDLWMREAVGSGGRHGPGGRLKQQRAFVCRVGAGRPPS